MTHGDGQEILKFLQNSHFTLLRYISINIFVLDMFYHVRNIIICFISIGN